MRMYRSVLIAMIAAAPAVGLAGDFDSGFEPALSAGGLYSDGGSSGDVLQVEGRLDALAAAGPTPSVGVASVLAPLSAADSGGGSSYIRGRIGPLFFIEDLEDLDVGFDAEVAFGYRLMPFLAFEIQSGYFWGEYDEGGVKAELWGVPVVANLVAIVPVLILEVYAGIGVGGYYIDTDYNGVGEDDIVLGGNAFVGVGLTLGPVELAVEGKYIHTADFDIPGGGEANLQAFAVLACVGIGF